MAVLGITMICKFEFNPFNLGPFGGSHDVYCISVVIRMMVQ